MARRVVPQRIISTVLLWLMASVPAVAAFRTVKPKLLEPPPPGTDTVWQAALVRRQPIGSLRARITDLALRDDGTGIAATSDRRLLRTTDGGLSWALLPDSLAVLGVALRDDDIGLLVGRSGLIARSTDAGLTWT